MAGISELPGAVSKLQSKAKRVVRGKGSITGSFEARPALFSEESLSANGCAATIFLYAGPGCGAQADRSRENRNEVGPAGYT